MSAAKKRLNKIMNRANQLRHGYMDSVVRMGMNPRRKSVRAAVNEVARQVAIGELK